MQMSTKLILQVLEMKPLMLENRLRGVPSRQVDHGLELRPRVDHPLVAVELTVTAQALHGKIGTTLHAPGRAADSIDVVAAAVGLDRLRDLELHDARVVGCQRCRVFRGRIEWKGQNK